MWIVMLIMPCELAITKYKRVSFVVYVEYFISGYREVIKLLLYFLLGVLSFDVVISFKWGYSSIILKKYSFIFAIAIQLICI